MNPPPPPNQNDNSKRSRRRRRRRNGRPANASGRGGGGNSNCNEANDASAARAKKRRSSAADSTAVDNPELVLSIEEQLQRQRRAQKQEQQSVNVPKKAKPETLGRYRYDAAKDAYFPEDHFQTLTNTTTDDANDSNAWKPVKAATCIYQAAVSTLPVKRQQWASRLAALAVLDSCRLVGTWSQIMSVPVPTSLQQPTAAAAAAAIENSISPPVKDHLPVWSRTFDVATTTTPAPIHSDSSSSSSTQLLTLCSKGRVFTMTTNAMIGNNSWAGQVFDDCPISMWEMCRFLPKLTRRQDGGPGGHGGHGDEWCTTMGAIRQDSVQGPVFYYNNALCSLTNVQTVYDFCDTNSSTVLFAAGRGVSISNRKRVAPWRLDLGGHRYRLPFPVLVDNFPQSDALCIETAASTSTSSTSSSDSPVAYFGHRNGQLTMFDARSSTCQSTRFETAQKAMLFGPMIQILALKTSSLHQVLARGTNDTCRLYDLRQLSDSSTTCSMWNPTQDSAIVREYKVPSSVTATNGHYSAAGSVVSRCSGMATNPTESVVVAPYQYSADTARLGVWSLHTGDFVGTKRLAVDAQPTSAAAATVAIQNTEEPALMELCSTRTPAWTSSSNRSATQSPESAQTAPGSFGLFVKTNADWAAQDSSVPDVVGDVHHLHMDGRVDDL